MELNSAEIETSLIFTDLGGFCPRFCADAFINAIAQPSGLVSSKFSLP